MLDSTMLAVARGELAGRRLLEIDGPYGLGLKSVPLADEEVDDGVFVSDSLPVTVLQRTFSLSMRDLAAFEREPSSVDLWPLVEATRAVARMEDDIIFNGSPRAAGLTSGASAVKVGVSDWSEVGAAQQDLISAVSALDDAGMHGPYALALAPKRYNLLLRRFETAAVSELDVVGSLASAGVVKAPALEDGGVLVQAGREFAHIVVGQDLSLGFIGPDGARLEFFVSESLAVRVLVPSAVCILNAI
jgi:uncharacterized linocin/CFP29 family protein